MKLKFKHQPFQLDAVSSVVDCFTGQPNAQSRVYIEYGQEERA